MDRGHLFGAGMPLRGESRATNKEARHRTNPVLNKLTDLHRSIGVFSRQNLRSILYRECIVDQLEVVIALERLGYVQYRVAA